MDVARPVVAVDVRAEDVAELVLVQDVLPQLTAGSWQLAAWAVPGVRPVAIMGSSGRRPRELG
jgi:hypothetical protein